MLYWDGPLKLEKHLIFLRESFNLIVHPKFDTKFHLARELHYNRQAIPYALNMIIVGNYI